MRHECAEDSILKNLLIFAPRRALESLICTSMIDLSLPPANISFSTYRMHMIVIRIIKLCFYLVLNALNVMEFLNAQC